MFDNNIAYQIEVTTISKDIISTSILPYRRLEMQIILFY